MTREMVAPTAVAVTEIAGRRIVRLTGRSLVGTAAVGLLLVGFAGMASAEPDLTDQASTDAIVEVGSSIVLTGLPLSFTLSGIPGATVVTADPVTFNVETNNLAGYMVTVQSQTPTMAGTGTNVDSIPIGALSVRKTGETDFEALSSTDVAEVQRKTSRSAEDGDALSNDFQVVIPFVNEDTYTATLDYIATTL